MRKKVVLLSVLLLLLAGCVTQKRCFQKFPPDTLTIVEMVRTTEYRDTIIERLVPGDTIFSERIIHVEGEKIEVKPVQAETSLALARAWIDNDLLRLRLIQKDSVLRFKLDSAIQTNKDTIRITNTVIHEKEIEKPITKFPAFWIVLVGGFLLFFLTVLAFLRKR